MQISELFASLQGEGPSIGKHAAFIRFPGCNLNCSWCDSTELWTKFYSIATDEIVEFLETQLPEYEQRVIFTGGEPMLPKNMEKITKLLSRLKLSNGVFEVETNGTIDTDAYSIFDQVNCSPKLASSGEPFEKRVKVDVLQRINALENSNFKFVVSSEDDILEILEFAHFLDPEKIYLMPAGNTTEDVLRNSPMVFNMAMANGFKATTRLHTLAFGSEVGK